jgi:hypothetical protein
LLATIISSARNFETKDSDAITIALLFLRFGTESLRHCDGLPDVDAGAEAVCVEHAPSWTPMIGVHGRGLHIEFLIPRKRIVEERPEAWEVPEDWQE